MKFSNLWFFTLCALLVLSRFIGWSIPLRIAVVVNALVVLVGVALKIKELIKRSKGG